VPTNPLEQRRRHLPTHLQRPEAQIRAVFDEVGADDRARGVVLVEPRILRVLVVRMGAAFIRGRQNESVSRSFTTLVEKSRNT